MNAMNWRSAASVTTAFGLLAAFVTNADSATIGHRLVSLDDCVRGQCVFASLRVVAGEFEGGALAAESDFGRNTQMRVYRYTLLRTDLVSPEKPIPDRISLLLGRSLAVGGQYLVAVRCAGSGGYRFAEEEHIPQPCTPSGSLYELPVVQRPSGGLEPLVAIDPETVRVPNDLSVHQMAVSVCADNQNEDSCSEFLAHSYVILHDVLGLVRRQYR